MLGKNTGQLDLFTQMMYEKLIPVNHILLDIDKYIDFSFVYDIVKDYYSEIGRKSCDPLVIFKMLLLQYLYRLSDREVEVRAKTDVVFRWFLRLNIDDEVPDATILCTFRANRLGDKPFDKIFNLIVQK